MSLDKSHCKPSSKTVWHPMATTTGIASKTSNDMGCSDGKEPVFILSLFSPNEVSQ